MVTAVVWLRRDLRLDDNVAVAKATAASGQVIICYVLDPDIIDGSHAGGRRRLQFLLQSLQELDHELRQQGSRLAVLQGDPGRELQRFASENQVTRVYVNRDYTPFAKRRDARVREILSGDAIETISSKDQVIFEGPEIATADGNPYRVYSPYARKWHQSLSDRDIEEVTWNPGNLMCASKIAGGNASLSDRLDELNEMLVVNPGRQSGTGQLSKFAGQINHYGQTRDFPAADATSRLSVHLKFGTVSIRECARLALAAGSQGAEKWLSELIWRDFYQMIVDQYPHVSTSNFKPDTNHIKWAGGDEGFDAWCAGRTGFPLVDAAMRHLARTGWMHNRLRMIVASFLVKDLLVDWRRGEDWFRRQLLDYDFASNNGGWQWAASTGVDAQPYFRVFNPVLQSRKFDPDGEFIRGNVAELAGLDGSAIHWPHGKADVADYPDPVVDHAVQRELAIEMFRST